MGGADIFKAGERHDDAVGESTEEPGVDRSHNRDTLSSEVMTEMLRDLQDAMLTLDERLAALESSQEGALGDTRKLAQGVADMGDALARRLRAVEQRRQEPAPILAQSMAPPPTLSPRPPPSNRIAWIVAIVFVILVVAGAFWLLRAESIDRSTVAVPTSVTTGAASPAPAVTPPSPPPPRRPTS